MAEGFLIEIRNRSKELLERRRLTDFPVSIGRAYNNDIIIDDCFVCAEHLRISVDEGSLRVEDLQSLNGVFTNGSSAAAAPVISVSHGTELRIGETTLLFIDATKPVADTLPLGPDAATLLAFRIRAWHAAFVCIVALLLSGLLEYWFEYSTERSPLLKLLLYGLIAVVILWLPWAGTWALVGHVVRKHAFFPAHLTVVAFGWFALEFLWLCSEFIEFSFGAPLLGWILYFGTSAVWFYILLRYHLRFATRLPIRTVRRTSLATTTALLGIAILSVFADSFDFSDELPLETNIKPPAFQLVASEQVESFIAKSDSIEQKLQEAIRK